MCEVGIQHPAEESGRKSSRTVVRFRQLFFHRIFAWGEKATQRFNLSQVGVCILDAAGRIFVGVRFSCEILLVSARFCEILLSFNFCCIYDVSRSRAVGKVVDHDGPHTQNKLLLILLLLVFGCFLRTENHRYLVANGAEIMHDFLVVKTFACFSAGAEFSSGPIAEPVVRWTLGSSW